MIRSINPNDLSIPERHGILLSAVSPRPIAFASTVDANGNVNLSPFSFFNVFSSNPPILVFSPARRGRENTTKHTLDNVEVVKDVAISVVSYDMVQQMSLASSEFPQGVNEFVKSGFTESPSETIQPPFVKEAPVSFECKVNDIIHLGDQGGAGNLVICEVLRIHMNDEILNEQGQIDPNKIDTVARMGGFWYCRASGDALFQIPKPLTSVGIGYDMIPKEIRNSGVLTGNELGQLGNIEQLPSKEEVTKAKEISEVAKILSSGTEVEERLHQLAKGYLAKGQTEQAWAILMSNK
ncbi:MAG: flavin reductase family protein [Cyclobacteriaceae bacterium]|nr:flavin reductase family protein [Cyclobacteriaceae bacterium]